MQAPLYSVPLTLRQTTINHASTGDFWLTASLGQSLVGSLLLSPGSWCTQDSVCVLQESVSTVLCKFWWLYGGVNDNLLQEGLCHTQVCCTQSPCPWGRPLLTHTFTGDTQTQFWLHLCGVSGSWCAQVCLSALSLVDKGFDSKPLPHDFASPTILLGTLLHFICFISQACLTSPFRTQQCLLGDKGMLNLGCLVLVQPWDRVSQYMLNKGMSKRWRWELRRPLPAFIYLLTEN